jgi:hypothetical protein
MSTVDKWQWFDAIYAEERFSGAEKAVLGWLAAKAVFTGRDIFRIRQSTVAARTGEGERTVQRAYKRARDLGYLTVVGQRERGLYGKADEYRLMVPAETQKVPDSLAGTSVVVPDRNGGSTRQKRTKYPTETAEVPDRANSVTCENADPISSLEKFSIEVLEREVQAAVEPLDVHAVPDHSDALSLDLIDEKNYVDAELVDEPHDPEPPEFCDAHMPYGTGDYCGPCKPRRINHGRWKQRQTDNLMANILRGLPRPPASPPAPRYRCTLCQDTDVLLMSDGRPGSTPAWCEHNGGGRRPMTDEEISDNADLLARLDKRIA